MKARHGKIARLPHDVREQLNERLERSEPSTRLLPWLNALPETLELVQNEFAGVPISKQNVSQWRRGGFQEWLAWRFMRQQTNDGVARLLVGSLAALMDPSTNPPLPEARCKMLKNTQPLAKKRVIKKRPVRPVQVSGLESNPFCKASL